MMGARLAFVDLLLAVAERLVGPLQVAHHLAQAHRLQGERVIRPLRGPVQREMLLDRPAHPST